MDYEIDNFDFDICIFCGHGDCTCEEEGLSYQEVQELMKEVIEGEEND